MFTWIKLEDKQTTMLSIEDFREMHHSSTIEQFINQILFAQKKHILCKICIFHQTRRARNKRF